MATSAPTLSKFPNSLWMTISSITATTLLGVGFSVPYISRLQRRKHLLHQMQEYEQTLLQTDSSSLENIDRQYSACQKLWTQFQYNLQMDSQQNKSSRISFALSHMKHLFVKTIVEMFDHSEAWYWRTFHQHQQRMIQILLEKYLKNTQLLQHSTTTQEKVLQLFKDWIALFEKGTISISNFPSLVQQFQTATTTINSWKLHLWMQILTSYPNTHKQVLVSQIQELKRIDAKSKLLYSLEMIEFFCRVCAPQKFVEYIVLFEQTIDWLYEHWMICSTLSLEAVQFCILILEKKRSVGTRYKVKMNSLEKMLEKANKYNTSVVYIEFVKSLQVENIVTRVDVFVVNVETPKQIIYIPIPIYLQNSDESIGKEIWNQISKTIYNAVEKKQTKQNLIFCLEERMEENYATVLETIFETQFPLQSVHIAQSFTQFLNSE